MMLIKEYGRLDVRKYSLSQRTINELDKLSNDCMLIVLLLRLVLTSVNMFKNRTLFAAI